MQVSDAEWKHDLRQRGEDFEAGYMNKFIEVKTWEDCYAEIEGIRRVNPMQASNLLFRGLSDSTWKLSTTLERRSGGRNFSFKDYYRLGPVIN
jgi:hypothetical protein